MQIKKSVYLVLLAGLAGCATLPTSGPTGKQVEKSALAPDAELPVRIVEVTMIDDVPLAAEKPANQLADLAPPPTDMIGPGDVLDITIYEAGITLFSGTPGDAQMAALMTGSGAQAQKLPATRVGDNGYITIPYAGTLNVAGHTVTEVQAMIRASLRRLSQNPQVIVTPVQNITNSIILGGEISRPGRLVLQTNRETLSEVIALGGGYRGNANDLTLRISRSNRTTDIRLGDLLGQPELDVRAYPGDRLMLLNDPQTFSVMGASGRVEQLSFSRPTLSLAEAISTAGGSNPSFGDPAAIFLFRYEKNAEGVEVPVAYHINMMKTQSYFLAQRFGMRNKDVLYFGNAAANQPGKLAQLVSQFFTPLMTVTAAVQTVQNSN